MSERPPTIATAILTADGLLPTPYSAGSLAEAAAHEPRGVYTITRTYRGDQALLLDDHLDRMEESARLEGVALQLDRTALRAGLRTLLKSAGYAEARFRLTVPFDAPNSLYLSAEPFTPIAPEVIQRGVRVITLSLRRDNPAAKTTDWVSARRETVEHFPPGVYEGILLSRQGALLEGTSSNFYAVLDGALRTAGEGVLSGISRKALLQIAPQILPVDLRPVHRDELWAVEEAFLTSASRGVVPIVLIDAQIIGNGAPGPQTMWLREVYEEWTAAHIAPI
jgi:branched-chain amino acid aminotransferase